MGLRLFNLSTFQPFNLSTFQLFNFSTFQLFWGLLDSAKGKMLQYRVVATIWFWRVLMKSAFGFCCLMLFCAVFAAGCGGNGASAEDVSALRKEVAELRAEVRELSRHSQRVRQVRGESVPAKAERHAKPRPSAVGKEKRETGGGIPVRMQMTSEQRKARIDELRKRNLERKKASKERRAQRRAARRGEGADEQKLVPPADEQKLVPPADEQKLVPPANMD